MYRIRRNFEYGRFERIFVIKKFRFPSMGSSFTKACRCPLMGPLMANDGPNGTAMAIDELRWDPSTGYHFVLFSKTHNFSPFFFSVVSRQNAILCTRDTFHTCTQFFPYPYITKVILRR